MDTKWASGKAPHFIQVQFDVLSVLIVALSGHVRFIDYEYSSYNYLAFDIGNHFNEFAGLPHLVASYVA